MHSRLEVTGSHLAVACDVSTLGFALTGYAGGGEVLPAVAGGFPLALPVSICMFTL